MNSKKIILSLILVSSMTIGLISCSSDKKASNNTNKNSIINKDNDNATNTNTNESTPNNNNNNKVTNGTPTTQEESPSPNNNVTDEVSSENDIAEQTKNYIINGQGNISEAQKIKWSESFLNKVDIESLYKEFIDNGGSSEDLENFSKYITLNATIPSDWESLFEKDLFDAYGEKVVKLEHLNDDLYQAYILKDGSEVPYVVVSSRTGYFHG